MQSKQQPLGYILYRTPTRVAIATGFSRSSANPKTGPMIQIWIIRPDVSPVDAVHTGQDSAICGTCPLRSPAGRGFIGRQCYVQIAQAPQSIYHAFHRGAYVDATTYTLDEIANLFEGRAVRLGAYGDPGFLPLSLLRAITSRARRWTGYTQRWRLPSIAQSDYRHYLMASTTSLDESSRANSLGWRYFRVVDSQIRRAHV